MSRRGFLRIGGLGVGGLTLAQMLDPKLKAETPQRAKSVIMICLFGGPPQLDTYDLKPDAPSDYRGEFQPIKTNVPGVDICELFPLQAKMWDKLAVIRSVVAGQSDHRDQETHTGFVKGRPCFGSVISKVRGVNSAGVPPFVNLRFESSGLDPTYLGVAHRAFSPRGPGLQNLGLRENFPVERLHERRDLLHGFDTLRRDIDSSGVMNGMDALQSRAVDIVLSGEVRRALDVSRVDLRTRERYKGVEQFLTARRLVEAGVGAVTMDVGNWDTHFDNFKYCREWLPKIDRGLSNLISDLHDLGLDKDVITVMWGEFGRTPKINNRGGRDHWDRVMSTVIAGGGLKMGQAIGSTSARAEEPKSRPYRVPQVLSTIYQAIGIDPSRTFPDGNGRPMHILDDREQVSELI